MHGPIHLLTTHFDARPFRDRPHRFTEPFRAIKEVARATSQRRVVDRFSASDAESRNQPTELAATAACTPRWLRIGLQDQMIHFRPTLPATKLVNRHTSAL